jgi:predicted nuclease with RNAse H fold
MITAGIDVASQTAHTAACVIEWADDRARVTRLSVGVDDDSITELITGVDKVGIDAPLGWPIAFADAITQHTRDGSWPSTYQHADTSAFRLRATDLWVWKKLGMPPPLSVSTDRIALPAMRIAALLSRLPVRTALDGSGVVVEVYPAAALGRWGLPSRGYKRRENSEARRVLVERFLAETRQWLSVGETDVNLCLSSDDGLDALIAALVARAAAVGLVEPIQPEDRASAAREGWIAAPSPGSLRLLALDR